MSVASETRWIAPAPTLVAPGGRSEPDAPLRSNTSFKYCAPADVRDDSTGLSWNVAVAFASPVEEKKFVRLSVLNPRFVLPQLGPSLPRHRSASRRLGGASP